MVSAIVAFYCSEFESVFYDCGWGHFFVAVFDKKNGLWTKVVDDCLMTSSEFIERFAEQNRPIWLLGEGLVYYMDDFKADGVEFIGPDFWSARASGVFNVGKRLSEANKFESPEQIKPFYLRRPDALERLDRR